MHEIVMHALKKVGSRGSVKPNFRPVAGVPPKKNCPENKVWFVWVCLRMNNISLDILPTMHHFGGHHSAGRCMPLYLQNNCIHTDIFLPWFEEVLLPLSLVQGKNKHLLLCRKWAAGMQENRMKFAILYFHYLPIVQIAWGKYSSQNKTCIVEVI